MRSEAEAGSRKQEANTHQCEGQVLRQAILLLGNLGQRVVVQAEATEGARLGRALPIRAGTKLALADAFGERKLAANALGSPSATATHAREVVYAFRLVTATRARTCSCGRLPKRLATPSIVMLTEHFDLD